MRSQRTHLRFRTQNERTAHLRLLVVQWEAEDGVKRHETNKDNAYGSFSSIGERQSEEEPWMLKLKKQRRRERLSEEIK